MFKLKLCVFAFAEDEVSHPTHEVNLFLHSTPFFHERLIELGCQISASANISSTSIFFQNYSLDSSVMLPVEASCP